MSRKKHKEDHVNHEAWAIPYGDLVTLLLAFFVVMYAVSSVNEGKYRVLSDSLVAAFRGVPRSMEPIQTGAFQVRADQELETGLPRTLVPFETDRFPGSFEEAEEPEQLGAEQGAGLGPADGSGLDDDGESSWVVIERLEDEVLQAMAPLIDAEMISVRRVSYWLEVEINTNFLFASGSSNVAPEAVPVIRQLAGLLHNAGVRLQVEGHTDSVPISTAQFPSNWELSAGRAASVVHLMSAYGINPAFMAAVGYGEHRPVADNNSADGRRKNRRVVIIVMSGQEKERELASSPPDKPAPLPDVKPAESAS
jgi:chemotaxis protein MotB